MDGEDAPWPGATPGPGTGPTPGPGTGSASGPAPATPAEVKAVEEQLLGHVVDAPEAGGFNPHEAHPGGAPPSAATKPTVDDVAAYVGLLESSQAGDPAPAAGPIGSVRRLRNLTAVTAVVGGSAAIHLILALLAARPGGSGAPGGGSATGASSAEAPAQQGDAAPPAVDGAQPGAGGDGGDARPVVEQPAGAAIPASCLVPQGGALDLELTDVSWEEGEDGLSASWDVLVHNRDSDTFTVFLHRNADANAATRANKWVGPPVDWDVEGYYLIAPDPEAPVINSWSGGVSTSVEPGLPTLCSWESVDRVVAVYYRPECSADLWAQLKAAPDAAGRDALMRPLAIDMPAPEQMKTFECPQ
jgi:hypothetical protein